MRTVTSILAKQAVRKKLAWFQSEYAFNRMPLMCTFAYVVAKKSGYPEKLSKSLAYAVATYYAIMKNVGLRSYGGIPSKIHLRSEGTLDDELIEKGIKAEYLDFCGGSFAIKDNQVLGITTIRGRQNGYEAWRFDNQIARIEAVKKGTFKKICKKWEEIIAGEDLEQIRNGRLYFKIWKANRDYLRSWEFLDQQN